MSERNSSISDLGEVFQIPRTLIEEALGRFVTAASFPIEVAVISKDSAIDYGKNLKNLSTKTLADFFKGEVALGDKHSTEE